MKFLICFFLILFTSCKSSNYIKYHNIVNEAEYSFYHEDYSTSTDLYGKAFRKVNIPFENDTYFFAASAWLSGNNKLAIQLLDTSTYTEYALNRSGYFDEMSATLKDSILKKNILYTDSVNIVRQNNPLCQALDSVFKLDQESRSIAKAFERDFPEDTLGIEQYWRQVSSFDSLNLIFIQSINFAGGVRFPARNEIVGYLLIHQTEWVSENKKVLKKAIKDGRLSPVYYARPFDYQMIKSGNDCIYYGQWGNSLDCVSPEEVFKRSVKLGISPYYSKYVRLPKKRGIIPTEHYYYKYYESKKDSFNCY